MILVIRLVPGLAFLFESIQKFIYADTLGPGRFRSIGIPHAAFWGAFVGIAEIICGLLLIIGLFTKVATIPLIIDMIVVFVYTNWPLLIHR